MTCMTTFVCQAQTGIFGTFLCSASSTDPGCTVRTCLRLFAKLLATARVETTSHVRSYLSSLCMKALQKSNEYTQHMSYLVLIVQCVNDYGCLLSSQVLLVSILRYTCCVLTNLHRQVDPRKTWSRFFVVYVCMFFTFDSQKRINCYRPS